jgi:hypothetical protein
MIDIPRHAGQAPSPYSKSMWDAFLANFRGVLAETEIARLRSAWRIDTALENPTAAKTRRTRLYQYEILPKIAELMGMTARTELFKVDSMFGIVAGKSFVPIVHVESENESTSAHQEINKLCVLSGRLKVLITCAVWSDNWVSRDGRAKAYLKEWRATVADHARVRSDDSVYGVIVAERIGGKLRFFQTTLSASISDGAIYGEEIIEIDLFKTELGLSSVLAAPSTGQRIEG